MTHVTCRLTAKNRDQLRNPTFGNRVWASFTLPFYVQNVIATTLSAIGADFHRSIVALGNRVHGLPFLQAKFVNDALLAHNRAGNADMNGA